MSSPRLHVTKQTYPNQSFLYTSNEQDTEIKTTMPFTLLKRMKCLDINLTKHLKNFYAENHTMLMTEIKDLNGETYHAHVLQESTN